MAVQLFPHALCDWRVSGPVPRAGAATHNRTCLASPRDRQTADRLRGSESGAEPAQPRGTQAVSRLRTRSPTVVPGPYPSPEFSHADLIPPPSPAFGSLPVPGHPARSGVARARRRKRRGTIASSGSAATPTITPTLATSAARSSSSTGSACAHSVSTSSIADSAPRTPSSLFSFRVAAPLFHVLYPEHLPVSPSASSKRALESRPSSSALQPRISPFSLLSRRP